MRKHWMKACLLLMGALWGPMANRALAQGAPWEISGQESTQTPLPIGPNRGDGAALYGSSEFLFMKQTRHMGTQTVATRGFRDSDGSITGTSGTFIGSGNVALSTESFGRTTWVPGMRTTIGYRMEDGVSFDMSWVHLTSAKYTSSAGPIPSNFSTGSLQGEDAFLFSPVFNFSPQFSGPLTRLASVSPTTGAVTTIGSGGSPYGVWNGAANMTIAYTEKFNSYDLTARMPVLESEYAKTYTLAGGRFAWIWEKFQWRTVATDFQGNSGTQDQATYTNIMSQRMYGPFMGVGNSIFLGNRFAFTGDLSGALLYGFVKERAYYELGDGSTRVKRGREEFTIVPNVNASLNLEWFPIQGVQIRAGYNFWSFFNTIYMNQPIGFNAGAIDPAYSHQPIRIIQGINVGIGISF